MAQRLAAGAGLSLETVTGTGPRGQIRRRDIEAHLTNAPAPVGRPEVSPAARRRAQQAGLELAAITGGGPGGRTSLADVEAHLAGSVPEVSDTAHSSGSAPIEPQVVPFSRSQAVVARRMSQAKSTIPDFHVSIEVDMEACRVLRAELAALARSGPVPSFNDMVIKACALALREHPRVNSSYRDDGIEIHPQVNIGMAVAAGERLLVATVPDADQRSLEQISAETRRLADRVRDETVTPAELSAATFTVSNLGMLGVADFTAVINPPQAAILAVGALEQRAVVRDAKLEVRATMRVTLTADHRIVYGADAARFLASIRTSLEQPLGLLLGGGLRT